MKKFGFLSFGHYDIRSGAKDMLHQALELSQAADELGVNGAYFRVHHFAPQGAAPMPLLSAIAATTKHIEVGTGVIDMRYENPLYLAEEAAQLDLLSNHRIALGVSRGSPEPAERGYEAFGYTGSKDPRGADIARAKWEQFLAAVRGEPVATAATWDKQYPRMYREGAPLPVLPQSPGLDRRLWWGAGSAESARQVARDGVNLMSSTLLAETSDQSFGDLQAAQIQAFREEWAAQGHDWEPRVSVSRSIFPITNDAERAMFGRSSHDQVGIIDDLKATFGRTYADEPDKLVEALKQDAAVMSADTLMLTIPNQAGVALNLSILENFAKHVAPELGWEPARMGA